MTSSLSSQSVRFLSSSSLINLFKKSFSLSIYIFSSIIIPTFLRRLWISASIFLNFSYLTTPPFFLLSSWFIFCTISSWISLAFVSCSLGILLTSSLGALDILVGSSMEGSSLEDIPASDEEESLNYSSSDSGSSSS